MCTDYIHIQAYLLNLKLKLYYCCSTIRKINCVYLNLQNCLNKSIIIICNEVSFNVSLRQNLSII